MEKIKKIGKTTIIIDTSYVDNRTPEQQKVDEDMLTAAVWAMFDGVEEAAG